MASNLADLVREAAQTRPHGIAFISEGRTTTWDAVDRQVHAVAGGVTALGLESGDRVAIVMENCVEFITSYFGVLRAGLVAVPVSPAYTKGELVQIFEQSGAKLALTTRAADEVVRAAAGSSLKVITVGTDGWRRFTIGSTPPPSEETDPESLALLLFTSGTRGTPRAAMLKHRALLANIEQIQNIDSEVPMLGPEDVSLVVIPMFHIYGLNALIGQIVKTASTGVIVDRFDPVETSELIKKWQVTNIMGVPGMFISWSSLPDIQADFASVRLINSGAAPLSPAVFQQFTTSGATIWEGYGMTESAAVISSSLASGRAKPGSVGQAIPGVETKLLDDEGEEVRPGDPGEICVRGANLFSGYWPNGDEGPDEEGWFPTGDIAYQDEDGDLHLVDRRKELVLVNGFNVYPREIERVLLKLPSIALAAVVGVRHPYTGEAVKAYVVPTPGADLTIEDVTEHCSHHLARFKNPSIIEIVDSLPHSVTGKIRKGELRRQAQLELDQAEFTVTDTSLEAVETTENPS